MSRAKLSDNSTTVSLFPFLAVLLCTMGALLVVLVAVSRTARDAARREVAAPQPQAAAASDPELQRELEQIDQFNANLKKLRSEAEQQLRGDQLRLGQMESHMRRLQDQLEVLQLAAAELDAMEEEHYDDREQAQREIERLERLVAESRAAVEELKEKVQSGRQTYALIPYEGPNGTFRRPIYIECLKDVLILQPEGVQIHREDLYPPFGAGNPLAAAMRAARDYYVQLRPEEGRTRDSEPYPLLVVRPQGLLMYDRARRAIQSSDLQFGFELVEDDWKLEFPVADPQLATLEQQAIDQARIRQQALAAAAPRAYRQPALVAAGRFELSDDDAAGFGFSDAAGDGNFSGDFPATQDAAQLSPAGGPHGNSSGTSQGDAEDAPAASDGSAQPGGTHSAAAAAHAPSGGTHTATPGGGAATSTGGSPSAASGASGGGSNQPSSGGQVAMSTGSPPADAADPLQSISAASRGRDWALDRKKPSAVPIRRTIQVVVRSDHVSILGENEKVDLAAPGAKRIALEGDTVQSLDPLVTAVREQIDGWGFAGDGLYWRPVLILNVPPDGRRRSEDLTRLLQDSGLELRTVRVAANPSKDEPRATR